MKILFVSMGYPSKENPSRLVFLKHLVDEIANQGNQCVVIAPARRSNDKEAKLPYFERHVTEKGNTVDVYFPKYFSVWLQSKIKVDLMRNLSIQQFYAAVVKTIEKEHIEFDCVYSHFLWVSAMAAVYIGKKYNVPAFGAAGESTFEAFSGYERDEVISALNQLTGIISVSSENKNILLDNHVLDIVEGVVRVMKKPPEKKNGEDGLPIPPYAIYNIGNSNPENLLDFVQILSEELVRAGVLPANYDFETHKELVPMQPGDVPVTYADTSALERDFGFKPRTPLREGLRKFAEWYKEFYMA